MDLATEILTNIIENHKEVNISINVPQKDIEKLFSDTCYKALVDIQSLIENEELSDFMCVEGIVQIFERIGSSGGFRNDEG